MSPGANSDTQPASTHMPALDGLRAIAVLWVMIFHYELSAWAWNGPLGRVGRAMIFQGWLGVDLFFALSGFLITGILWDTREREGYYRKFYARRTVRIFPLHYVYLGLVFFVLPVLGLAEHASLGEQLWFWTYTGNIPIGLSGFDGAPRLTPHFWSLAVEEQFYLLWPLLVRALGRTAMMRLCVGCVVLSLGLRVAVQASVGLWHTAPMLTPLRLDGLALGAFGALFLRGPLGVETVRRWGARLTLGAAAASVLVMAARRFVNQEDPIVGTVGLTLYSATFASLVTWLGVSRRSLWLHRLLTVAPLRSIGQVSYGMYVLHFLIRHAMTSRGWSIPELGTLFGRYALGQFVFLTVNFGATYLLALLSFRLLESPILRLKRHFEY